MAFNAIISHRIHRDTPTSAINITPRPTQFVMTGLIDELAYELKTQFIRKSGKQYGRFSNDIAQHPISSLLKDFNEDRQSFESFTKHCLEQFKLELDKTESYLDAYLFFAIEKIEAGDFLYVYVVEHATGIYLDSDLNLSESKQIDASGMTLAAKINLNEWKENSSSTYLTLMRTRAEKEISDAFAALIGFSDKHDIKTETQEFLSLVDDFNEALDESTAKNTRTSIVSYCLEQKKIGKPVVIKELSESLSKELKAFEPDSFSNFVEKKQPEKKTELIPDAGQLRSYIRISGRNDSLSMSFASDCLGKEIEYDVASDILTIKNIPPALKARLLKHLKQQ
jgi:nucleoid-associated protein